MDSEEKPQLVTIKQISATREVVFGLGDDGRVYIWKAKTTNGIRPWNPRWVVAAGL